MYDLYRNIKKIREAKGMSQEELARKTGYTSRSSIAKIENGRVDLSQTKILLFAQALGVTPTELLGLSSSPAAKKYQPHTLANILNIEDFTEEELQEIGQFADFILSRREKKE